MAQRLVQRTPIGDHCIVFVLSWYLSSTSCMNECWLRCRDCSRGNFNRFTFNFFFTLIPSTLEPSETHLKGPWSTTPLLLFIYKSLAIMFYLEHIEANTTYSKEIRISLQHEMSIIGIERSWGWLESFRKLTLQVITVLYLKAMVPL